MAERHQRSQSPPPKYSEAINSISGAVSPFNEGTIPPLSVSSLPQLNVTSGVEAPRQGQGQSDPPTYDFLFTTGEIQERTTTEDLAHSSVTPEVPPAPSLVQNSGRQMCGSERIKCCGKVVAFISTVAVCMAATVIGFVHEYGCLVSPYLPALLKVSGISGLLYLTMIGLFYLCKRVGKEPTNIQLVVCMLAIVLLVISLFGCSRTYSVWVNKPCYPGVGYGCTGYYCDDTLMWFSIVFYTTSSILLVPLWSYVLYLLCRTVVRFLGALFCPSCKLCQRNDHKGFLCFN